MTATEVGPETFWGSPVVVGTDDSGLGWVGTQYWLIREDCVNRPKPEGITAIVEFPKDMVQLERFTIAGKAALVENRAGPYRVFKRPDDQLVMISDRYCRAIERALEPEPEEFDVDDPEGAVIPSVIRWHQRADLPLSAVGITVDGNDQIVAVVMPCRIDGH